MTATPAKHSIAPVTCQRAGRCPSTHQPRSSGIATSPQPLAVQARPGCAGWSVGTTPYPMSTSAPSAPTHHAQLARSDLASAERLSDPCVLFQAEASECFRASPTAERAVEGIKAMHVLRQGEVKRLEGKDAVGCARFVASLFGVAA